MCTDAETMHVLTNFGKEEEAGTAEVPDAAGPGAASSSGHQQGNGGDKGT